MKVNGGRLMMLLLMGWLHCPKGGLISGAGCSVYHGRFFNGSGDCKFIPQAPPDGPPVTVNSAAVVVTVLSYIQ